MVYATAAAAIVGAAYGIYAGEAGSAERKRGRKRQGQAQQQAMAQQSSTAARAEGRKAQRRRGRQIAIANAIRKQPGAADTPAAPSPLDAVSGNTPTRTLG